MREKMKLFRQSLIIFTLVFVSAQSRDSPPKIDLNEFFKNPSPQYFESNDEVILACTAEGHPTPTYEWFRDGQKISSNYIDQDPISGDLRIASLTKRETGAFRCHASNDIGGKKIVSLSPIMEVKLAFIDGFDSPPDSLVPRITADEGQAVKLTCDNAPDSAPDGQFKWYKQDENGGEVVQDERIAIDQEGSLHFAYVTKNDDLNNQEYKCAISNRRLDTIKLGSPKILEVQRTRPIPNSEPVAVYVGTPAQGIVAGSVDLECIFSGNPVPEVTWTDNEQKPVFTGGRYEFVNDRKILRINKLEERDEGTYTCRGTGFAEKFEEKQIALDVTSKPIWVQGLKSQTLPANRDAVFTCNARSAKGEPDLAAPIWLENGANIPGDKFVSKYEYADDQKTLIVKNVQKPNDVTCFQCIVKNDIGEVFDDGCLDVIDPILITYRPPAVQEIIKDQTVNLTITATTDPSMTLQYKWYFNNVTYLDVPPFVTYDPVTMVTFIDTTDLSDEDYRKINGTYIREVFHKFERVNITMEVLLKEVGIAGPVAAAGTDLWWIALVIGILLLVCVIAIICIVCRRKAQEGVYPLDKKERAND
ncbi:hypothetical protein LOTGIDRAFT_239531 [Lottia gigantea]|uniref:Ig-like domain-containing protein n=1 Tax=Lottia gigantea TaxID=225164 RepID=V4ABA8_LOTGI|nr:hypothetical protein LOTGIDRAFT_239531 [Lottia gigantea]ESO94092.1 hypothetical protein LOTGIDRAFT_239531 [Lottia gigantea]